METSDQETTPVPVLPYDPPAAGKLWRVGTLAYTSGGLVVLFCWLLWGDFAWSMKERAIAPLVPMVLKTFKPSDLISGLLIVSLPAAVGVVFGPIISYRSDRHRGPWGRRIPYLMITTPIAVLGLVGVAFSARLGPWLHQVFRLNASVAGASILVFGISWTLFEFATVAANGIFGALINDVVPRSLLGRFFGLFRALSLIAGIIFNLWLIGKAQVHYVSAFLSVSALYGVGFAMMCLKVKEGDYPPPPPPSTTYNPISRFVEAIQIYFKECFTNPYYFWVFMAMNLGNLAFIPVNGFSVYYAQSLNMSMATYGKYIGWTYVISLGLAYPLGILSDRFHPLRMSLVSQALYAVCSLWGAKYALGSGSFGIALVAHGVLSGCYFTTSASLGQRLFPHSRFAQFASAQIMIQALSTLALGPILGRILDRSGHIYRYTFVGGLLLSVLAVLFLLIVNQEFVKLGGSKHYVAPE